MSTESTAGDPPIIDTTPHGLQPAGFMGAALSWAEKARQAETAAKSVEVDVHAGVHVSSQSSVYCEPSSSPCRFPYHFGNGVESNLPVASVYEPVDPPGICEEAAAIVKDRQKVYGRPFDNHKNFIGLFNEYFKDRKPGEFTVEDVPVINILQKLWKPSTI